MLRDRFRRWGINDKNVRNNSQKRQHVHAATQLDRGVDARLYDPLDLPHKTRFLHHALRGLLRWSDSSQDVGSRGTDIIADAIKFHDCFWDMKNAIRILEAQRMCSATCGRRPNQASNRLVKCFKASCTPLGVLLSMQVILELKLSASQNILPWSETTSKFLLQVTASHFIRSHPVSMLIFLLTFGNRTSHELTALYEAVRVFIGHYLDRPLVLGFRTSFFQTMLSLKSDTMFESEMTTLCIGASDSSEVLDDLRQLYKHVGEKAK